MRNRPTISVIIPTFDRARYITNAINSVLSQSFQDFEIIVVDDGSTDNTKEVIRNFYPQVKYIYQDNSGVGAARNTGILASRGEWIAFLDSDDEWMTDYLKYQMEQACRFPEFIMFVTNSFQISVDGNRIDSFEDLHNGLYEKLKEKHLLIIKKPLIFIIKYHITILETIIMKREALIKTGLLNEKLTIAEDLDIIARMALQGPLVITDTPLVHIFRRNENIDNLTKQLFHYSSYDAFFQVYNNLLIKNKFLKYREKFLLKKKISSNRRAYANYLLELGKKREARQFFREALVIYPSLKSLSKFLISFFSPKIALYFIKHRLKNV